MEKDRRARLANQARLRALRSQHGDRVTVVCAHDVREFERAARRPHDAPAGPPRRRAAELGRGAASPGHRAGWAGAGREAAVLRPGFAERHYIEQR